MSLLPEVEVEGWGGVGARVMRAGGGARRVGGGGRGCWATEEAGRREEEGEGVRESELEEMRETVSMRG